MGTVLACEPCKQCLPMECQVLAVIVMVVMCEKHWRGSPADGAFASLCIGVLRRHVDNRLACSAQALAIISQ